MDFVYDTSALSECAGRSLKALIGKFKSIRAIGFFTYTKVLQASVCQVLIIMIMQLRFVPGCFATILATDMGVRAL